MSNRQVGLESLFGISQQGNFKIVTLKPQKGQPLLLRVTNIVSDSDEVPGHLYPCAFVVVLPTSPGFPAWLWLSALALGQELFFYK